MTAPKWNAKHPAVPVDKDGNWLHFPMQQHEYVNGKWTTFDYGWEIVQTPFYAALEVVQMNTGRSAKYLTVRNRDTGVEYPLFVSDLVDLIKYGNVANGVITGTWTGSKRGQNYGIKIVKPKE
jgi:hypothetical protein